MNEQLMSAAVQKIQVDEGGKMQLLCKQGLEEAYKKGWEDCWADLMAVKAAIAEKKKEP